MAQDGQSSKKPLEFVDHVDDLEAHQAFLLDLVAQGKDAWNLWRNEHPEFELNFTSMEFPDKTSFNGFDFGNDADFSEATFGNDADFIKATFGNNACFSEATFGNNAYFIIATFGDEANISEATFGYRANFNDATFGDQADFSNTKFGDHANLIQATYGDDANFSETTFGDIADFSESTFGNQVYFMKATFGSIARFTGCTFAQRSYFDLLSVKGNIDFGYSSFIGVPSIQVTSEDDKLKINLLEISIGKPIGNFSDVRKLQLLKGIADSTNAVNESRDIFILQRQAERKNAWKIWRETVFDLTKKTTPFPLPKSIMAGLFWILSDYGRSVVRPIAWLLLSIPLFYYLYHWLYPAKLKMAAQRDALIDYTLSSSIPFGRMLNPAFDRAFEWLFPETHHQIIGTVDITIGFQLASIVQGIVSVILLFLIGLSIRNYFKIS